MGNLVQGGVSGSGEVELSGRVGKGPSARAEHTE